VVFCMCYPSTQNQREKRGGDCILEHILGLFDSFILWVVGFSDFLEFSYIFIVIRSRFHFLQGDLCKFYDLLTTLEDYCIKMPKKQM